MNTIFLISLLSLSLIEACIKTIPPEEVYITSTELLPVNPDEPTKVTTALTTTASTTTAPTTTAPITTATTQIVDAVCQFTPFEGLNYALIATNANWDTSNAACIACGAQMMGMPSGAIQIFVEQTLGANTVAFDTAWVNIRNDFWCSFYTFKSGGKQFAGTNCETNAKYVLCVK